MCEKNDTLAMTEKQRRELDTLLTRFLPGCTVWAYGSRINGVARAYSDLDLVAFLPEDKNRALARLREALEESNLPFRVDLHNWYDLPDSFHPAIRQRHVVITGRADGMVSGTGAAPQK